VDVALGFIAVSQLLSSDSVTLYFSPVIDNYTKTEPTLKTNLKSFCCIILPSTFLGMNTVNTRKYNPRFHCICLINDGNIYLTNNFINYIVMNEALQRCIMILKAK